MGETKLFKHRSTIKIKLGGITRPAYQSPTRVRHICEKSSLRPLLPPIIRVKVTPVKHGPKSMMGNIIRPTILGSGSRCKSADAATDRAPTHEIANVAAK